MYPLEPAPETRGLGLISEIEDVLSGFHQAQLIPGDIGLTVRVAVVFYGVGQIGVCLPLGDDLSLGLGQVHLSLLDLAAQVQQGGGHAGEQCQHHQLGQYGRLL